jgi:pantetheine-phosphate adenylyltransferase
MVSKAVFIGSFYPMHIGHVDIISKMYDMFGRENVLLYAAINPSKIKNLSQIDIDKYINERIDKLKEYSEKISHHIEFLGYKSTAQLMEELDTKYGRTVLIRGLRDGIDYQYEEKTVAYLRELYPNIKVVYIPSSDKYKHISSSDIRNMLDSRMIDLIQYAKTLMI